MTDERNLDWQGCYNVRDLGGLPLLDGGQTRWGSVIRADMLGRLTEAGKQAALDYGLRTVIDLRRIEEREEEPTAVFPDGQVSVLYPTTEGVDEALWALFNQAQSMGEVYILDIEHLSNMDKARVLRMIANAPSGAVVVHCHAGKDRTGIISALLLSLAGVADEDISADYALSQERLWPLYELLSAEVESEPGKFDPHTPPITRPEDMQMLLDYLRTRYGSVEGYVRHIRLTDDEMQRLRDRLVENNQ